MVDLILLNGKIRTQDPRKPAAEAVAVKGSRIVAVGQSSEVRNLAGPRTGIIDLEGRLMLPGSTDCHFHFYDWVLGRSWVNLKEVHSLEEFLATLKSAGKDSSHANLYGG